MASLKVPVIAIVIGEGGSGGALGIGIANRIMMLENSTYSVISPEGAALLWKDSSLAKMVAETMKITAKDLHHLNVIDSVIDEPLGGAHNNIEQQAIDIKQAFVDQLEQLQQQSADELVEDRFNKFRNIGAFIEK